MAKGLILAPGLDNFLAEHTITTTKPDHVVFLCTEATMELVTEVVQSCSVSSYKTYFIKDIFSTAETIQEFLNAFQWLKDKEVKEIVIDATNVITVVEMATYVSASLIDLYKEVLGEHIEFSCVYVHCEYALREDGTYGEVRGTERLIELEKPIDSLSFVLAFSGVRALNKGRYEEACEDFERIQESASGDKLFLFRSLCELAKGYESWDKMSFSDAKTHLTEALENTKKTRGYALQEQLESHLKSHLQVLDKLINNDPTEITLDLFANAQRRLKERRYDDALARFYAFLERIIQIRLAAYNIDTKKPDYTELDKSAVEKFEKSLGYLPVELELKRGALLLINVQDPIGEFIHKIKYKSFVGLIGIRNSSILAHGIKPVEAKNVAQFLNVLVNPIMEKFLKLEKVDQSDIDKHQFIEIKHMQEILAKPGMLTKAVKSTNSGSKAAK